MATEWSRPVNTIISDYFRGSEDKLMRKRKFFSMLKSRGQVEYSKGGLNFVWRVPYQQGQVVINNGAQPITPQAVDRYKTCTLEYTGYVISETMTKREQLMGQGKEAIINYFKEMAKQAGTDIEDRISEDLYVDSSASGNNGRMSGIETMMAGTQTLNIASGVARTANAADPVVAPNDTYAGLLTNLGQYGGSWNAQTNISSVWPAGRGDYAYDFFSPTIVNTTSSAFGGATATWKDQCETATRYLLDHLNRNGGATPDMILHDRDRYRLFKEKQGTKERIIVESKGTLRSLGFKDVIDFEGCEITSEYGIPAGVGYAFNIENITLRSMQDTLFKVEGPWFEKLYNAWVVKVDNLGQLKFHSPRFFGKLVDVA